MVVEVYVSLGPRRANSITYKTKPERPYNPQVKPVNPEP